MNFIKVRTVSADGSRYKGTHLINIDMINFIEKGENESVYYCYMPQYGFHIDETDAKRIFNIIGVSL